MNLILNLVRQILLDVSRESTTQRKSNYRAKSSGARPADILLMQVRMPTPSLRDLAQTHSQFDVRAHTRHLMHRKDYSSTVLAAENYDVKNFMENRHPGPSLDNFRPDVSSPKSRWNQALTFIFAKDFVESGKYSPQPIDAVERAFSVHLNQLIKTYKSQKRTNLAEIQAAQDREHAAARESRRRKVGILFTLTSSSPVRSARLCSYTSDAVTLA